MRVWRTGSWYGVLTVALLIAVWGGPASAMDLRGTLSSHQVEGATGGGGDETSFKGEMTGTVNVNTALNIRSAPWGQILGQFHNGDQVKIVGRSGDWYKIRHEGGFAYVHSRYVSTSGGAAGGDTGGSASSGPVNAGPVQQRIVQAARDFVNKYSRSGSFPYAPGTENGNLGCANVVTACLKAAGVINWLNLGVYPTSDRLKKEGWKQFRPPPYQAGDVVVWGPPPGGKHGHIGIIMQNGNNVQAMSNSSSQRRPRIHDAEYRAVQYVLRKT